MTFLYHTPAETCQIFSSVTTASSFTAFDWLRHLLVKEEPEVNYRASVASNYSAQSMREQLRVAGALALVETFGFPLSRIAINVALPENKRKKAFIVVYRDEAKQEVQLILECYRGSLTASQRTIAFNKTLRKAQALNAAWALCAIGERYVLAVKTDQPKPIVELPFTLKKID